MNNIMLDLETMSDCSNAAIVSIGAVKFDIAITDRFYCNIDLQSCLDCGLSVSGSTIMWWLSQSGEARNALAIQPVPIKRALEDFAAWAGIDPAVIWGNGAAFDNAILANAYRKTGIAQPWAFWNDRCYRTIRSLHPDVEFKRVGIHHRSVDDAESQALHLIKILGSSLL
jgi:hypothetical protein